MQDNVGGNRVVKAAGGPSDCEANRVAFEAVAVPPAEDTPPAGFAVNDKIDRIATYVAFPPSWKLDEIVDASEGLSGREVEYWHFDWPS